MYRKNNSLHDGPRWLSPATRLDTIAAGVRKGVCQAVIQQTVFAGITRHESSVRESLRFWTDRPVAGNDTYPEQTPCSRGSCALCKDRTGATSCRRQAYDHTSRPPPRRREAGRWHAPCLLQDHGRAGVTRPRTVVAPRCRWTGAAVGPGAEGRHPARPSLTVSRREHDGTGASYFKSTVPAADESAGRLARLWSPSRWRP